MNSKIVLICVLLVLSDCAYGAGASKIDCGKYFLHKKAKKTLCDEKCIPNQLCFFRDTHEHGVCDSNNNCLIPQKLISEREELYNEIRELEKENKSCYDKILKKRNRTIKNKY
jgi:hypothetical protein